ncbi:homeotic protein female sterile [Trichonephila clavipes]|nr:homeotic protein female sterile [Trichonephila clavipes]
MDPQPPNLAQLATALESAWLNIPENTFRDLSDSLPARLAAVRSAKAREENLRIEEQKEKLRIEEREEKLRFEQLRLDEQKRKDEFELEKLRIKHNPNISLYLKLFERQAQGLNIDQENWGSHLLGLLPTEVSHIIAREPDDKANSYEHVKDLLLKRFKLTPEKFRQLFVTHQKASERTWIDFTMS